MTTISIKKVTREKLRGCGKKGESWDELVNRMITVYQDNEAKLYYEGEK